jgi:aspartate aminotransferase
MFAAGQTHAVFKVVLNKKSMSNKVSELAQNLIGSEIIKLAGEINEKIKNGSSVYNFTIGDFNPALFPIPDELKAEIVKAYEDNQTNYPAAEGVVELREAVSAFLKRYGNLDYSKNEILIAGGARPVIYAIYQAIVDPGDKVIFPVPSWNNNHYTYLSRAQQVMIEASPENNFMPTAAEIAPHLKDASLLALCSPLNPTGTVFAKEQLEEICDIVLAENKRRGENEKPLYLMYDQIYWLLTIGDTKHYDPVSLRPELRPYTIFVDGISKGFAATGVRVGWAYGPENVINKMKAILGHVGAWSPKAEQVATTHFLNNEAAVDVYLKWIKGTVKERFDAFYKGFTDLKNEGFDVDVIVPRAAIYMTIQFNLKGKKTADGKVLENTDDVTSYILNEAGFAVVPFFAFGSPRESSWYRLSVGTSKVEEIPAIFDKLRTALKKLS